MNTIIDESEEMLPEYDFSKGVRGKHFQAYQENTTIVFLEDDVAQVFKTSEAVNHALRMLIKLAHQEVQNV
ncbi:MAG: hypothetical protein HOP34_10025 [Methylococcaceae bacterium]|nr:hypothetical protein [Methylococcaceae bacterium]